MKIKNSNTLLLTFLSICIASLEASFFGFFKEKQEMIAKIALVHTAAHLIYKSRGPRTDEMGNWLIDGKKSTRQERYEHRTSSLSERISYLFDTTFGTESDWKNKEVHIVYPIDESNKTQTTTVVVKKQCFATGSGLYCWYADNVLRHLGDVGKHGFGLLATLITINEVATKLSK